MVIAVGAFLDWPLRMVVPVMAANIGPHATPSSWPVHIYKSPGCVATTIGYSLVSMSLYHLLAESLIVTTFPFEQLKSGWTDFVAAREAFMKLPSPEETTHEDRIAWSNQVIALYRNLLNSTVPGLRSSIYVTLSSPLASLLHGTIIWPLRRIYTWMSAQTPTEIATLAQNPVRMFQTMVKAEGSVLAALYGGVHVHWIHSAIQMAFNLMAGGIASYGINHVHRELNRFMDYQQRHNKIYDKRASSPAAIHESLLMAGLGTMRIAVPAICFVGTIGSLISARMVAMPLALMGTMRILQNSPSLATGSFLARYAPRMDFTDLARELILGPLRSQVWTWIGWHWKWFMLSTITLPLGINVSADLEIR